MAQFFKKRRGKGGPSKNEQKVARGREAANRTRMAGTVGQRFPALERLTVKLEFISPQGQTVDTQSRGLGPDDAYEFSVPCPGRCGQGSYDLAAKIQAVIEAREGMSESSGQCRVPTYPGSPEVCGYQLKCRIEATYFPQPAGAETQ